MMNRISGMMIRNKRVRMMIMSMVSFFRFVYLFQELIKREKGEKLVLVDYFDVYVGVFVFFKMSNERLSRFID